MGNTFLNIISWLEQRELPCLFKKYLHVDCPGCGFQRSFIALLKGNISESFLLFPTTFALLLFFACFFINNKYELVSMKKFLNVGIVFLFTFFTLSYLYKIIKNIAMTEQKNLLTPNFNQAPVLPNATAALVLGIISIVSAFCYGVGIVIGIIGLVLANKDRKLVEANQDVYSQGSVSSLKAGRICSIVGIVVGILFLIIIVLYLVYFMPMILEQVKKNGKY